MQNQRVLHRLPVIALPGPDDPEPAGQVHGPGAGIGLPDLKKDFPPSTKLEFAEARFKESPAYPPSAMVGIYREVQHFTLARHQASQKVPLEAPCLQRLRARSRPAWTRPHEIPRHSTDR